MNNFSLEDFFSAFKSLRTRNTSSCDCVGNNNRFSRGGGCCESGHGFGQRFDCVDEEVSYMPEPRQTRSRGRNSGSAVVQQNESSGCRHTEQQPVVRQDECGCQEQQPVRRGRGRGRRNFPAQQQPCEQPPAQEQQTVIQQNTTSADVKNSFSMNVNVNETTNINNGINDGPGDDTYDGPGDDTYVRGNYIVNTSYTQNNFVSNTTINPKPDSTIEPTTETTEPPGPDEPDDSDEIDLLPLRNLLNLLDFSAVGDRDGELDDIEINRAMKNPGLANLDGNPRVISDAEIAVFNKIKAFNEDKTLMSNVMKGNFSAIDNDTLVKLGELSDTIAELTKNRD